MRGRPAAGQSGTDEGKRWWGKSKRREQKGGKGRWRERRRGRRRGEEMRGVESR